MDIVNKIVDFCLSEAGQLVIAAIVGLIGVKYGQHFRVTPAQVEATLDKLGEYKQQGKPVDTEALSKEIQRQVRDRIFGKRSN